MRRGVLFVCVAALVAFAACESEETVPPASADLGVKNPTFSFLAVGDFGEKGSEEEEIAEAVHAVAERRDVDAFVSVGDNAYPYADKGFLETAWEPYTWVGDMDLPVFAILGNHDVKADDGAATMEFFDMPGRYYQERLGDADLFFLDATIMDDEQQRAWLEEALAGSTAPWRIVVMHYTPFSCSRSVNASVAEVLPTFERHGVDVVLMGHEHNYQRFQFNDIAYVVDGGGGADLYGVGECPAGTPPLLASEDGMNSYVAIQGNARVLELMAFGLDGTTIDELRLRAE